MNGPLPAGVCFLVQVVKNNWTGPLQKLSLFFKMTQIKNFSYLWANNIMECCVTTWIAWGNFLFLFPLSLNVCTILSPVAGRSKARDSKRVIKEHTLSVILGIENKKFPKAIQGVAYYFFCHSYGLLRNTKVTWIQISTF